MLTRSRLVQFVLLLSFLCGSCKDESTNVVTDNVALKSGKQLLYGVWHNTNAAGDNYAYLVYDSSTSNLSVKLDQGCNFRCEGTTYAKVDSHQIWIREDTNWYSLFGWYRFSKLSDSLFVSQGDSLFSEQRIYVRDTSVTLTRNWVSIIPTISVTDFPGLFNYSVRSFAVSDSFYYLLTGPYPEDGILFKYDLRGQVVAQYYFPGSKAMEVSGEYLWLIRGKNLEKRKLVDTSLTQLIDLHNWAQGIAVTDTLVYVITFLGSLEVLSASGAMLYEVSGCAQPGDLTIHDGKLLSTAEWTGNIHVIDLTNTRSQISYVVDGYGVEVGLASKNDKLIRAAVSASVLSISVVGFPK